VAIVLVGMLDEREESLNPEIEIIEVETHINTPEFARAVVGALEFCNRLTNN
jgi:uncharacterized protein (UPF0261 family)